MNKEEICNDGRCKRVRMGEEIHSKHLNKKIIKKSNNNAFFRNYTKVQVFFWLLIIGGTSVTFHANNPYVDPLILHPILKIALTTIGIVMINLAFVILNKGISIHTEDRIRRIESKLDKILEHRDNVFQNK